MRIMRWNKLYNNLNLNLSQLSKSFIKRYLILRDCLLFNQDIPLLYHLETFHFILFIRFLEPHGDNDLHQNNVITRNGSVIIEGRQNAIHFPIERSSRYTDENLFPLLPWR